MANGFMKKKPAQPLSGGTAKAVSGKPAAKSSKVAKPSKVAAKSKKGC